MNIHELKENFDEALRELRQDGERVEEEGRKINVYTRLFEAAKEQIAQIADLNDELERRQAEIDDLTERLEQREAEIADLQQQLLEAQNQQLESENQLLESEKLQLESRNQSLEAEVNAKPTEIHNHFGKGSSAQVFNDKVTGKFLKIKKPWKKREKRQEKRRKAL